MSELSALELAGKIRAREVSVEEVATAALEAALADELNAFVTVCEREQVLARAREVQAKIDAGELADSPLAGVPIAVKDNICTKGVRTTCGSRMLESFVPSYDATVMERLNKAGLVLIGKTNMDEFGMGSTSETSAFGPVKNPISPSCVAGGSSGGSAAAVAAGIVPLALGTDTGGSIRQPASHCGVFGLKPTYGAVSRFGLVAYASSMDQIGPIARTAEDAAALFDLIRGADRRDTTSCRESVGDRESACQREVVGADSVGNIAEEKATLRDIKIGVPRAFFSKASDATIDPAVAETVMHAARELEKNGATLTEFDLELTDYMVPAYYVIACAEASSNLERFDGVKYGYRAEDYDDLHAMYRKSRSEGFGEEVKRRILLGTFVLSQGYYDQYYLQACKVRRLIAQSYKNALKEFDMILSPVTPATAPHIGDSLPDPIRMYMSDLFTVPANLAGLPAVSIPCGTVDGMPVGMQLAGDYFSEKNLLQIRGGRT